MRVRITRRAAAGALLVALGALPGCTTEPPAPLRIAINPWPGYEHLYLAAEKGFFAQQGARVKLVEFGSLNECRRSFERGQVDGFAATTTEVVMARAQGRRRPAIVLVTDYSSGADVIVARTDLPDVRSLRGRRVAAEAGSVSFYLLARALHREGMRFADVQLRPMHLTEIPAAFGAGEVDAAVTYASGVPELTGPGGGRVIFSSRDIPDEIVDVLAIAEDVIASRSPDIAALIRGFERARGFAVEEPDEAIAIMAEREGLDPDQFRSLLQEGVELLGTPIQVDLLAPGSSVHRSLTLADELLRNANLISTPTDLAVAIDTRPILLVEGG